MNPQPTYLENDLIKLVPLASDDFERIYLVASDPLIWEQHPNKFRYKRDVFQTFFNEAIASGSAFLIFDAETNEVIGSSRYYDYDAAKSEIAIGYTFLARSRWGGTYNRALKQLMIDHAFESVGSVLLHIGEGNIRSQKAAMKIGGKKVGQIEMEMPGEAYKLNYIFEIKKEDWNKPA